MDPLLVLAVVLGGLLIALVVLLALPARFTLRVERDERTRLSAEIGWLGGRLPLRYTREPGTAPATEAEREEPEAEPTAGPSALDRASQALAVLRTEGFLERTGRLVGDLVRSFRFEQLSLRLHVGTGDPADTGILYGRVQAAMPALRAVPRAHLALEPDFDRRVAHGSGQLALRAVPLRLLWSLGTYLLSPATLRAVRAARRAGP